MSSFYIDLLGYVASFIILVSLTMKSLVKLRWINAFGSLLFVVFAFLTHSLPTIVMNLGIVAIDMWFVIRMTKIRADYRLVKAERGSAYLDFFYQTHQKEIDAIFGESAYTEAKGFSYFVCNNEIAGLFAWRENSPTECQIMIDYVTPRYRDTKIGRYFFDQQLPAFREKGYACFVYRGVGERHWKYLEKIGFRHDAIGSFVKEI
jgi:GNAT superfamily N-acetyltransferase